MPPLVPVSCGPEVDAQIGAAIARAVSENRANMDRVISDAGKAAKSLAADLAKVHDASMRDSLKALR